MILYYRDAVWQALRSVVLESDLDQPIVALEQAEQRVRPKIMRELDRSRDQRRHSQALAREIFRSNKTYDHSEGLSCCFRQGRATSHCRQLHGYALAFRFVFATHELDVHNWCYDFGGLKPMRQWLHDMFDHTTLVAEDDPERGMFEALTRAGLVDLRVIPSVGCEATARYVFDYVARYVDAQTDGPVWLESVEVKEHGGNSAIYERCGASKRHSGRASRRASTQVGSCG
jgi:6-pyruvoyltetrahydropterin/6-carboxytetrahydropterin synthase